MCCDNDVVDVVYHDYIFDMPPKKIVVASGYFDVLHAGHVEYLQKSKALGDVLIVIVNNDRQAKLKKGFSLMSTDERIKLIRALSCVDVVVESIDEDRTVCKTLAMLHPDIFAKGGDQNISTIPEATICRERGIQIIDGLGDKIQSSRWVLGEMRKRLADVDERYLTEGM